MQRELPFYSNIQGTSLRIRTPYYMEEGLRISLIYTHFCLFLLNIWGTTYLHNMAGSKQATKQILRTPSPGARPITAPFGVLVVVVSRKARLTNHLHTGVDKVYIPFNGESDSYGARSPCVARRGFARVPTSCVVSTFTHLAHIAISHALHTAVQCAVWARRCCPLCKLHAKFGGLG